MKISILRLWDLNSFNEGDLLINELWICPEYLTRLRRENISLFS